MSYRLSGKILSALVAIGLTLSALALIPSKLTASDRMMVVDENTMVKGYVTDAETGEGIANVSICIYGRDYKAIVTTDATGYYEHSLAPGEYWLDFYPYLEGYFQPMDEFFVIEANQIVWLNFTLEPLPSKTAAVKGRVTDAKTGEPIEGITVNVQRDYDWSTYEPYEPYGVHEPYESEGVDETADTYPGEYPAEFYLYDHGEAVTDETGYYEIALYGGDYILTIYTDIRCYYGYNNYSGFVYPPGSTDLYLPYYTTFTVAENETLWLNISLEPLPEKNSTVSGYVRDAVTGEPIPNIEIHVSRNYIFFEEPEYFTEAYKYYYMEGGWAVTDASGYYEIALYPGNYSLTIYPYRYWYRDWYWETDTELTELQLYYPYETVFSVSENENLTLNIALEPLPPLNSKLYGYITDSETGEPVVDIEVSIRPLDEFWRDYDYGDEPELMEEEEVIYPGYTGSANEASANGRASECSRYTWFDPFYGAGSTFTDDQGYYEFDIRAGNYMLDVSTYFSIREANELMYYPYTTEFTIEEEQTLWLNISLDPLPPIDSCVKGKVTDSETGEPIPWAAIWLSGSDWFSYFHGFTDEAGDYKIDIRAGHYTMYVQVPRFHDYGYYDEDIEPIEAEETRAATGDAASEPREDDEYYVEKKEPIPPPPHFPGKRYFDYHTSFTIGEGETIIIDIELDPYPAETSTIKGIVKASNTGEPIPYAWISVTVYFGEHRYFKSTYSGADGHYEVQVPAAHVRLQVTAQSYYGLDLKSGIIEYYEDGDIENATMYFPTVVEVDIGSDETIVLDIELDPVPPINSIVKGRVIDADGEPVAYALVRLIDFEHYSGLFPTWGGFAWTSDTGEFQIRTYAGHFAFIVEPMDFYYLDGLQPYFEELDVLEGEEKDLGNIILQPADRNTFDLELTFDKNWDKLSADAEIVLNRGVMFIRYMIDFEFGNGDGVITDAEADRAMIELESPGNLGISIEFAVDDIRYYPIRGTGTVSLENIIGSVLSTEPVTIRFSIELEPAEPVSSTESHKITLNVRFYMGCELTYKITLPEGYEAEEGERKIIEGEMLIEPEYASVIGGCPGYRYSQMLSEGVWAPAGGAAMTYARGEPTASDLLKGNELCTGGSVTVDVEYVGVHEKKEPRKIFVPGFELVLTIIALLASLACFRFYSFRKFI